MVEVKMAKKMKYCSILLLSILVSIILLIPGSTPSRYGGLGFNPVLSISEPPVLGKPVKVTLTFTPQKQFDTYTVQIVLPQGIYEVVEGRLEVSGIPATNPSIQFTIKSVMTTESGEIIGYVRGDTPRQSVWESNELFIAIVNNGATVSTKPLPTPTRFATIGTLTFYPSLDGYVSQHHEGSGVSWSTIRGESGNQVDSSASYGTATNIGEYSGYSPNYWYHLTRSLFLFDTSSLPDDATITSATLSVYGKSRTVTVPDALPKLNVYSFNPVSTRTLEPGDFTSLGNIPFSSDKSMLIAP